MNTEDKKKLQAYSDEIGISSGFDLDTLISSHRRIREINRESHINRMAELERARAIGEDQGFQAVTNGKYVEVEKLKAMTISELMEFLS